MAECACIFLHLELTLESKSELYFEYKRQKKKDLSLHGSGKKRFIIHFLINENLVK